MTRKMVHVTMLAIALAAYQRSAYSGANTASRSRSGKRVLFNDGKKSGM
jgi:hypothetical protein